MQDNNFNTTVQSLFKGMDSFITTKTVIGEAVHIGDTIILPLIEVSFGVGAGAFNQEKKNSAGGGLGGRITPSAVLVIQKSQKSSIWFLSWWINSQAKALRKNHLRQRMPPKKLRRTTSQKN